MFFSFDYSDDLWRASVVRNRWIADPSQASGGFWDPAFEDAPPSRDDLERFVEEQIQASDVTAVLIGARTASCEHVLYAIRRSAELGHGLVGIYIDQCRNRYGSTGFRGPNPFDRVTVSRGGQDEPLSAILVVRDWVRDDGFGHLPQWIEDAVARPATGG